MFFTSPATMVKKLRSATAVTRSKKNKIPESDMRILVNTVIDEISAGVEE